MPELHDESRCDRVNEVKLLYLDAGDGRTTWAAVYHMPHRTPERFRHPESGALIWEMPPGCVLLRTTVHDTTWAALDDLARMVMLEERRRKSRAQ